MHTAYEEGRAANIEYELGKDAIVYKDVYPGACRHCIRLYLTNGFGSQPRLFKLSALRANGTNIGRKPVDWLAVLGPIHPWCRCTLNKLPPGYKWDDKTKDFVPPANYVIGDWRKSKIKITIGDKTMLV